jgi:hypothetical protein
MSIYFNTNRKNNNSSQQEKVKLIHSDIFSTVDSYQIFNINKTLLEPIDNQLKLKSNLLKPILEEIVFNDSFLDIGSSNGYFTYLAKKLGFKKGTIVEHDTEYTDNILEINNKYDIKNINILNQKFQDISLFNNYDVVCMLALIHWIYSCTEINSNFDNILSKLSKITNNILILEWIDKDDPAIKLFKHLSFNYNLIEEEYCEQNFIKSINKYFNSYYVLPSYLHKTRKIYIIYKDFTDSIFKSNYLSLYNNVFYKIRPHNSLDNGTSDIYITKDKTHILKKPRNYIEEFVYEREMFWYDTLKNECFIPKLIYKDDLKKEFIIEYFGNRISIINKPQDWEEQLLDILNILKEKYKWDNPDLKPTEILVSKEGKLGIIDFGWCTLNNDYKCGKGYKNNKFIDLSENIITKLRKKL